MTTIALRGPDDTKLDSLVGKGLFGDGAAAIIIGADPVPEVEKPLFELVSTAQTILPDSDGAIGGRLREVGLTYHLLENVPELISKNIEKAVTEAFQPLASLIGTLFSGSRTQVYSDISKRALAARLDQVQKDLGIDFTNSIKQTIERNVGGGGDGAGVGVGVDQVGCTPGGWVSFLGRVGCTAMVPQI
ncbi:hypothetical protein Vadar_033812 [Vaccinium darrowii]|uniref:Uncharacterized protein n=1 Tax=Vaccinium darrowii TaxID=229202 RepID=A0ACB7X629_9ERIC|nr:hypothetical protein Vadar_033812 [Vaccinium darrowii]